MANKFKEWVNIDNISNVQTYDEFSNDSQRNEGFKAGEIASSKRINSALRQANLVACALMNVVAPNNEDVDLTSSVSDVKTILENGLKDIKVNNAINSDKIQNKELSSSNEILFGNYILRREKLLWNNDNGGDSIEYAYPENVSALNKTFRLEFTIEDMNSNLYISQILSCEFKIKYDNTNSLFRIFDMGYFKKNVELPKLDKYIQDTIYLSLEKENSVSNRLIFSGESITYNPDTGDAIVFSDHEFKFYNLYEIV